MDHLTMKQRKERKRGQRMFSSRVTAKLLEAVTMLIQDMKESREQYEAHKEEYTFVQPYMSPWITSITEEPKRRVEHHINLVAVFNEMIMFQAQWDNTLPEHNNPVSIIVTLASGDVLPIPPRSVRDFYLEWQSTQAKGVKHESSLLDLQ